VVSSIFDSPDLIDAIFDFVVAEWPHMAADAMALKESVRREFAGIEHYIPRRSKAERDRIANQVLALFNGRNATEVARRLQISRSSVYRIIKTPGKK
jgi:Mor family transcriptional regulator